MKTVEDFCRLVVAIKNNPGLQQIDIARILNFDRAKVSRLIKTGINNEFITNNGRRLYRGPILENRIHI
jgi:DNA-binding MarR family transcriptional regulator